MFIKLNSKSLTNNPTCCQYTSTSSPELMEERNQFYISNLKKFKKRYKGKTIVILDTPTIEIVGFLSEGYKRITTNISAVSASR